MTRSDEAPGAAPAEPTPPDRANGPVDPAADRVTAQAADPLRSESTDSESTTSGPTTSEVSSSEDDPDVGFTLSPPDQELDIAERARALMHQVARELGAVAPEGWQRVDAVFASTVAADVGFALYSDAEQRAVRWNPTPQVLAMVREHRQLSARLGDGPWWRLLLSLTSEGQIEVDYDYGDEPFPEDQLFAPEIYRADLEAFPRSTLPVWLAAYVRHGDRQQRPPAVAAARSRAERAAGIAASTVEGLPSLPVTAARWAVLSAAFVAAGSEWGPRLTPAVRWFEGAGRSGCTLYSLPGGRAVLSGGVWNAPELDAAYNREAALPELFRGAPEWVAGPVLNHRIGTGQLTFCYWWDGARWYRGESPPISEIVTAVPGIWDRETVVRIVGGLVDPDPDDEQRAAVEALVSAAETGAVTRAALAAAFPAAGDSELDTAAHQLVMGGVTAPEPLPAQAAVDRVAGYLTAGGEDLSGYPVEQLRAERVSAGWMVYVPVEPGEIAVGRAIFYLADDGVLERSSSSVAPSRYIPEFERRFRTRNRAMV
ncbi:hypothetical protein [Nocardia sp. NPDC024068]|uniref:hypothetical protein n=1 Tax=Nocardia sp. NPDC024068 TaxID=3157197 RepID=UPI0033CEA948